MHLVDSLESVSVEELCGFVKIGVVYFGKHSVSVYALFLMLHLNSSLS